MSGYDEIGQHINLTNIQGPKKSKIEIMSVLVNYMMDSDIHTIKEDN